MASATLSSLVDQVLDKAIYHQVRCGHFDSAFVLQTPLYTGNRTTVQFISAIQRSPSPSPYHCLLNITLSESSFLFSAFRNFFSWRVKGYLRFQAISLLSAGERITVLMPCHVSPNGSITVHHTSYSGSSNAPSSLYILSSAAILCSLYTISFATFLIKRVKRLKQPSTFCPRVRC